MAINDAFECYLAASLFGLGWFGEDIKDKPNSRENLDPYWFPGCSYHVAVPPRRSTLNMGAFKIHKNIPAEYREYIRKNIAFRQLCKAPGIIEILLCNNSSFCIKHNGSYFI